MLNFFTWLRFNFCSCCCCYCVLFKHHHYHHYNHCHHYQLFFIVFAVSISTLNIIIIHIRQQMKCLNISIFIIDNTLLSTTTILVIPIQLILNPNSVSLAPSWIFVSKTMLVAKSVRVLCYRQSTLEMLLWYKNDRKIKKEN